MPAEERLQALEQLVTVMQSEVVSALVEKFVGRPNDHHCILSIARLHSEAQ